MQIYNIAWILFPISIYFIWKRYYLHHAQLWILYYVAVLLFSCLIDGFIMQLVHLIFITSIAMQVLVISKQTNGLIQDSKLNSLTKLLLRLQQELILIVYVLAGWLLIRIYTVKSLDWGKGLLYSSQQKTFEGLLQTLKGWNCTQNQFIVIPIIWLFLNCLSYWICKEIMRLQPKKDHLYKQYLIKYKLLPDIILTFTLITYNSCAVIYSSNLLECCIFWQDGFFMKICFYVGYSFTSLLWFYMKKGVFQIEQDDNNSDRTQHQVLGNRQKKKQKSGMSIIKQQQQDQKQ